LIKLLDENKSLADYNLMNSSWRTLLVFSLSFIQVSVAQTMISCPTSESTFLGSKKIENQLICAYGIGQEELTIPIELLYCEFPLRYRGTKALPLVRKLCLGSIEACSLECNQG
jgi:hypothetical protein